MANPDRPERDAFAPHKAAVALLGWYRAAGLTAFMTEAPRDRFAETRTEIEARASRPGVARPVEKRQGARSDDGPDRVTSARKGEGNPPLVAAMPRATVPDDVAIADAREKARSATTLDELRSAVETFEGCNLRVSARSAVFGEGPETASLMLVGDPPGRDEDTAGVPFVGSHGQLLTRMLAAIGLDREAVRTTHVLPWRPPGNRTPTAAEIEICLPFVERHIELVAPRVLVCFGSAARILLDTREPIVSARGRWTSYSFGLGEGQSVDAMAMLSPSYLLKQQAQKRLAWQDLMALKARLDEDAASRG